MGVIKISEDTLEAKSIVMILDFWKCSDEELIQLFVQTGDRETKNLIRDEVFKRYYREFDQTIRSILKERGISYRGNEEYYNTVFTELYQRIFSLATFEERIKQYDVVRPFHRWFAVLMRNEVIDWLRKVDHEKELSNEEVLKSISKQKWQSLDSPVGTGEKDKLLTLKDVITSEKPLPEEDKKRKELEEAIKRLPEPFGSLLSVRFVAYQEVDEGVLSYIAKKRKISKEEAGKEIGELRDRLRGSKKFEEQEEIEILLASLYLKAESLEGKANWHRKRLGNLDINNTDEIEREITRAPLKDLAKAKSTAIKRYEEENGGIRAWEEAELAKLKETLKRLDNIKRKREKLLKEYYSGSYYVRPSNKEMAALLGIKEGTVGSQKNRAKEGLRSLIISAKLGNSGKKTREIS